MTNILTAKERHRKYCTRPSLPVAEVGDVRFCEHGRVMLAYEGTSSFGPHWRTLSPVFDPVLYRRAKRALKGVSEAPRGVYEVLVEEAESQWTPLSDNPHESPTKSLSDMAGELVMLVDGPSATPVNSEALWVLIQEAVETVLNSRFGTDPDHTRLANVAANKAVFNIPIPWNIARQFDSSDTPPSE